MLRSSLVSGDFLESRTLTLRQLSRPHLHRALRPTHQRRFELQQGAWRAAVAFPNYQRLVGLSEKDHE